MYVCVCILPLIVFYKDSCDSYDMYLPLTVENRSYSSAKTKATKEKSNPTIVKC